MKAAHLCQGKYCRQPRAGDGSRLCYRCRYAKRKEENPMFEAFKTLRTNARRRGKVFTITFEYFKKFAIRVKYLELKGITKYAYHIDRIKEELGYIPGNLRLITNIANVKKYLRWRYNDKGKPVDFRTHTEVKTEPAQNWWD